MNILCRLLGHVPSLDLLVEHRGEPLPIRVGQPCRRCLTLFESLVYAGNGVAGLIPKKEAS
jgi:hypothetical protein